MEEVIRCSYTNAILMLACSLFLDLSTTSSHVLLVLLELVFLLSSTRDEISKILSLALQFLTQKRRIIHGEQTKF